MRKCHFAVTVFPKLFGLALFFLCCTAHAQVLTQVVKGTIKDEITLRPIEGAIVIVNDTAYGLSDRNGVFSFRGIPIGYCNVMISIVGYERKVMTEIPVNPGKQVVLEISLSNTIKNLTEVTVSEKRNKKDTFTAQAGVTSISLDQIDHVAASWGDPARLLTSLAGVGTTSDLKNDIVVRGNSPSGVSYRLDGIEIPEPNHGAEVGAYAKVSIIKSELLNKFDFYKGAFPNQFNDLGSSVIDLSLRPGNTDKQEFAAKVSMLGAEASAEGPFSKSSQASYLINYRYFTLEALNLAHIPIFPGQKNSGAANVSNHDINANINLPLRGGGHISIFGISGYDIATNTTKSNSHTKDLFTTTAAGVHLAKYLASNTSVSATLGYTNALHTNYYTAPNAYTDTYIENEHSIRPALQLNTRIRKRHQLKYGVEGGYHFYKLSDVYSSMLFSALNAKGYNNTFQLSSYFQWSYRATEKLLINAGASLNIYRHWNTVSPEPRVSAEYRINPKETFSLSAGMHSRLERLSYYLLDTVSAKHIDNKGLGPTRYIALSAGYRNQISRSLMLIIEAYFQYLYDVPVYKSVSGSWSAINNDYSYPSSPLRNIGNGRNYGVEITLQKNFAKNYYFLSSLSVYKAEQRLSSADDWHPSRYDGGFIFNSKAGKDFKVGRLKKNTFGANIRVLYAGGLRVSTPSRYYTGKKYINVFDENYSGHLPNYFRLDTRLGYTRNKKKWSWSLSLDIQNLTNQKNVQTESLSSTSVVKSVSYDFGILPIIIFETHF